MLVKMRRLELSVNMAWDDLVGQVDDLRKRCSTGSVVPNCGRLYKVIIKTMNLIWEAIGNQCRRAKNGKMYQLAHTSHQSGCCILDMLQSLGQTQGKPHIESIAVVGVGDDQCMHQHSKGLLIQEGAKLSNTQLIEGTVNMH